MSLVRLLRTAQVTLTHVFVVDEIPTDASGAVTATVNRLDGTAIAGSPFTASHGSTGVYSFVLPGQADVDLLTLDWAGTVAGAPVTVRDYVEIVGGHLFGLAEARAALGLAVNVYSTDTLAAKRIEVEQEFEAICRQAFVPRFARVSLIGRGMAHLGLPHRLVRSLRAVSVAGTAWSPTEVAAVLVSEAGTLTRPGGAIWPADTRVVVEYEHGMDFPPEEVRAAGILRLRSRLAQTTSGIPDRAISFTATEGGTYRLSTPSRQRTGVPEIDGVLERYTRAPRAVFA